MNNENKNPFNMIDNGNENQPSKQNPFDTIGEQQNNEPTNVYNTTNQPNEILKKIKESLKDKRVLGTIGVALVGLLTITLWPEKQESYFEDQDKPIMIYENEKYGFINTKGDVIIEPIYDSISEFDEEYAIGIKDDTTYIFNRKGKEINAIDDADEVQHISKHNLWLIEHTLHNSKFQEIIPELRVEEVYQDFVLAKNVDSDKEGLFNYKGKLLLELDTNYNIDMITNIDTLKDTYCTAEKYEEKGKIFNCKTGKVILEREASFDPQFNNVFEVVDSDTYESTYVYIENDKIVYETKEDAKGLTYLTDEYLLVENDYSYNFEEATIYDIKKDKMIASKVKDYVNQSILRPLKDYNIDECDDGYQIKKGDKTIVKCEIDSFDYLSYDLSNYLESKGKEYIMFDKDDETILYDLKNKKELLSTEEYLSNSSYSPIVSYEEDGKTTFYNLINNKKITLKVDYSTEEVNYLEVEIGNKTKYYNNEFELIYTIEED